MTYDHYSSRLVRAGRWIEEQGLIDGVVGDLHDLIQQDLDAGREPSPVALDALLYTILGVFAKKEGHCHCLDCMARLLSEPGATDAIRVSLETPEAAKGLGAVVAQRLIRRLNPGVSG